MYDPNTIHTYTWWIFTYNTIPSLKLNVCATEATTLNFGKKFKTRDGLLRLWGGRGVKIANKLLLGLNTAFRLTMRVNQQTDSEVKYISKL